MKEGVFFPNFWPLTQIKTWLGHYGQLSAEQLEQLQFCNNKQQFYLDLRWLRQLYSSQRTEFDKMVLLFDLFGIVVQTEHNLGIFSKHESRLQTHVIIAEQNLSVKNLVQHHPLMSVLQLQPLLMNATNLFGLVLENLIQYNVTVSIDQLLMILHDCQIKVDIRTNQPGPLISEFFTDNVREQYIADILQKHNLTSVQQVTPAILLQEFANWHLKPTQQNQLLKKLKQQGWAQSIFPTPQQKIFTPLLPHLQGILDQRHYVISLSAYQQEIRQQIAANKNPHYPCLSNLVENLNSQHWQLTWLSTSNLLKQALKFDMDLATLPVDCTDEALQYSWFIQQQLLPVEQMDTYVTKFWNSFDKSTYELITRVATVEELAHKWGLEKVTLEKNKEEALKVFTIWWHKMCLTNKLLVISQFQKLNLKQYFKPVNAAIIYNVIVQHGDEPALKKLWTL